MVRSTRSRSRGRAADKVKSPKATTPKAEKTPKAAKAPAPKAEPKMLFGEGEEVMARWPGSSLFFKAKVTYVREEDNEYDVEYENGTVYTIKAKDVYKQSSAVLKKAERKRSKSRGRSPARATKRSTRGAEASTPAKDQTDSVPDPKPKAEKLDKSRVKETKAETPTRVSARIAAKALSDGFSEDETEKVKLAPNPELPDARGKKRGWRWEWLWALVFMVASPTILVSLHTLCKKDACKVAMPKLSTDYKTYVDKESMIGLIAFGLLVDVFSYLPIGKVVNGTRMNGFLTLLAILSAVPALIYYKVPLGIVRAKYFTIMSSSIILSFFCSIFAFILARWGLKSNVNSKGNTGNPIVDIFNGRELNPKHFGLDMKLQTFRVSMITLAALNTVMVADLGMAVKANPSLLMAAGFQVLYAMDALFFEEYYFYSHDAMNSGCGWSLINSYLSFPFFPTLTTLYLMNRPAVASPWYAHLAVVLIHLLGYCIYRSSETQRCEFAKDAKSEKVAHLETITTAGNKKLIVSGWWGLVRHPNFLGELLIQWSWVLPAVRLAGLQDLVLYYLPLIHTFMLIIKTQEINTRNKRKYGQAWNTYTETVKSNIVPKVY